LSIIDDFSKIWIQSGDMMWVMRTYAGRGQMAVYIMTRWEVAGTGGCVAVPTFQLEPLLETLSLRPTTHLPPWQLTAILFPVFQF
jgi:hypothetical protein